MTPKKWIESTNAIGIIFKSSMPLYLTKEQNNAILIEKGMDHKERMMELRQLAITQLISLEKLGDSGVGKLEGKKYLFYGKINLNKWNLFGISGDATVNK